MWSRTNNEVLELFRVSGIGSFVKSNSIEWLRHAVRRVTKQATMSGVERGRKR